MYIVGISMFITLSEKALDIWNAQVQMLWFDIDIEVAVNRWSPIYLIDIKPKRNQSLFFIF